MSAVSWLFPLLLACSAQVSPAGEEGGTAGMGANVPTAGGDAAGTTGVPNAGNSSSGGRNGSAGGAGTPNGAGNSNGGVGQGGTSGSAGARSAAFSCNSAAKAPAESLRRLTMTQYRNTVRDLVSWATNNNAEAKTALEGVLEALPSDRREATPQDLHGSYRRLDQTLQQVHVDTLYDVGVRVGALLTQTARLQRVAGACATDDDSDNDADCRDGFIRKFGARALRRPLRDDEVTFYREVYGSNAQADAAAYGDVIAVLLNAPDFVYFVEHGTSAVSGSAGSFVLSAHELASRLSYQLWQTAPDDELLAAAADGSLLKPDTYSAQVARLVKDARSRAALREFFEDWMKVEDLAALDAKNSDAVFKAFAGADLPANTLRGAMIDDVVGMLDYYTWQQPSALGTLLQSEKSFAKDAALAKIYGVARWDGQSEPPNLPSGQRPGLFTRALFLASGSANTRPIMKGVFLRRHVLCDDIPPPPPGANAKPPELSADMTTRQVVEELTETSAGCSGCHRILINPLGFATENFDALGRYRTEQTLFDTAGKVVGKKAVDTSGVARVWTDDDATISGPAQLMSQLAASGKVEACLSRNYFRYTFARWEAATDGCALEGFRQALLAGGGVKELLSAAALTPSFKQRTFE